MDPTDPNKANWSRSPDSALSVFIPAEDKEGKKKKKSQKRKKF